MGSKFIQDEINLREVADDACGLSAQVAKNISKLNGGITETITISVGDIIEVEDGVIKGYTPI